MTIRILAGQALCVLLVLLLAGPLSAQVPAALAAGARIRVRMSAGTPWQVGLVTATTKDSIQLRLEGLGEPTTLRPANLSAVQVSRGVHSRLETGMAIGAGVGVAVSVAVLLAMNANEPIDMNSGIAAGALLSLTTAGLGALVGSLIRVESWQPVEIPHGSLRGGPNERFSAVVVWRP